MCVCVCAQGYVYSSASKLVGLELSGDFARMQNDMLQKYQMTDRVQVGLRTSTNNQSGCTILDFTMEFNVPIILNTLPMESEKLHTQCFFSSQKNTNTSKCTFS